MAYDTRDNDSELNNVAELNEKYNDYYRKAGIYSQWELAPGKDVIIQTCQEWLQKGLLKPNALVLDIGCGTGFLLRRLAEECSSQFVLFGVDISQEAISIGKSINDSDIEFVCADGTTTGLLSNMFDLIVSYGSLEHFPDPVAGISELRRVLKPDGLVLTMQPTLGVYRDDRDDEGWYQETHEAGQMQWNWKRETWEKAFRDAGISLFADDLAKRNGAMKPGNFYFGQNYQGEG